jgi:hypothetical protein
MRTQYFLALLLISGVSFSCQKPADEPPPSDKKLGPFTVTVSNRVATTATLNWTKPANNNNTDTIKYKVVVGNSVVASDLTATTYGLTNLVAGNSYTGKVISYTKSGDTSSSSFFVPTYNIPTPNYSYINGYYKVTETTTNISNNTACGSYTFIGKLVLTSDSTIDFITTGRKPRTWWTLDFPVKIFPAMNDSLMYVGATPRGRILDPNTVRMSYQYGTSVVYSVKQLWQKFSNPADTASVVYTYPNFPGMISTVAGNYTGGSVVTAGDGGPAKNAVLSYPKDVAVDNTGNVYLTEGFSEYRLRKVNTNGIITTIAGTGTNGFSGDGGPSTNAKVDFVTAVATDNNGNVYISDMGNRVIRKISTNGIITTIAGMPGSYGYSGDGGQALSAQLAGPMGITFDAAGNLYFADAGSNVIRKISTTGIITTVAGTGVSGLSGDGGPAISANLNAPHDVAVDASGNLYIADYGNHVIRKVNASTGIITRIAGTLSDWGFQGDGGAATSAKMRNPYSVAVDATGNIYFSDYSNNRIRKINTSGVISTVVGNGQNATLGDGPDFYGGDYGPPQNASIFAPHGIVLVGSTLYLAHSHRIRKVNL